ncbi:MAG: DUF3231 family protein [Dehalobacterium sp.]
MTILDKVSAKSRNMIQNLLDKECVSYIEAGLLHQIVITGRFYVNLLIILHNHAQDTDLKLLIEDALNNLSGKTTKVCEELLQKGNAMLPTVSFPKRSLESGLDIQSNAHLSDMEIAITLVNMHSASQMALLTAINQSYSLEIGNQLRKQLDKSLDWGYRLMQLMLHRNWLPEIAKVKH